jgi:hypothetical protein
VEPSSRSCGTSCGSGSAAAGVDDESFAQLCTITNLVRMGPKPGLFRSHINMSDGVIRVWRDWLYH